MKFSFLLISFFVFNCLGPRPSIAHSLPSHFNHQEQSHTEPKFERPNIRLRQNDSTYKKSS